MAFISPPAPDNERLRAVGHDLLTAPWGQSLGTVAERALAEGATFGGALPLLVDSGKLDLDFPGTYENPWAVMEGPLPASKLLSEEEWKGSAHYRKGLAFPGGVREDVASILAGKHDDRERAADILSRAPKSWLWYPAQFATTLAASMLDPLNVASAFVPVVSQARYAGMVSRLGKWGGRAAKGALEGGVGAAMVEPMLAAGQAIDQNPDYDMADSLVNIAFGTVFGGGLHMLSGVVGDALERVARRTRETALRIAVGRLVDGLAVDVEPVFKLDPDFALKKPWEMSPRDFVAANIRSESEQLLLVYRALLEGGLDQEEMVTLYRGEYGGEPAKFPDWIKQGRKELGITNAEGRWWTSDKEAAEWYKREAGEKGIIVEIQVPKSIADKYSLTSKENVDVLKFSRDPQIEYFLPKEIVDKYRTESNKAKASLNDLLDALDLPPEIHQELSGKLAGMNEQIRAMESQHREIVKQAVKSRKPVPIEVLESYADDPDIAAALEKTLQQGFVGDVEGILSESMWVEAELRKHGISLDSIRADYGAEGVQILNRAIPGLVRKGGLALDEAAASVNFESADALYNYLAGRQTKKAMREQLADIDSKIFQESPIERSLEEGHEFSSEVDRGLKEAGLSEFDEERLAIMNEEHLVEDVARVQEMRDAGLVTDEKYPEWLEVETATKKSGMLAAVVERVAACMART